jgi:hypothetical protein
MEEILKDIRVLVYKRLIGTATINQVKQIIEAIKQINEMPFSFQKEARSIIQNYYSNSNNISNTSRGI